MDFESFKHKVENFHAYGLYREKKDGSIYKIRDANEIIEKAYFDSQGLIEEEKEAYLKVIYEKYYNSIDTDES
ncbi:MAG: hypothetical protein IJ158_12145 [Treponema sp.]|nr:hypothetical protein [Treponema sp.]